MSTPNEKRMRKKPGRANRPRFGTLPRITPHSAIIGMSFIIIAYVILFIFLRGTLLNTPDIDRSDAFHFNLSLKYFLWDSLHHNSLPFWTDKLQGGFPIMAEGQIGALYLPNLIFLRIFDFVNGYNLLFVFSLFTLTAGMFLLLLELNGGVVLSLLLSFAFAFNGAVTFRWIHFNVIQVFSLVPLLFFIHLKWYRKRSVLYGSAISFLVSQMIFAGHLQIVFISLLGLSLWQLALQVFDKQQAPQARRNFLAYALWITLGVALSLPQLIPTFFLSRYSTRGLEGGYSFATSYSLPFQHLLSFAMPFPFGNVKTGTYPDSLSQWGLFWENSPYIGFLLAVLTAFFYLFAAAKKRLTLEVNALFAIAAFFILLSLGKSSPLYFIFDLPLFGSFRTPPKYLLMAVFFIMLGASRLIRINLKASGKQFAHILVYILLAANAADLVHTAFSYHLFSPSASVLSRPSTTASVKPEDRYVTFGFSKLWHDYFAKNGWKSDSIASVYPYLDNFLIPNSNLMWGLDIFDVNTGGLRMRRQDYINASLETVLAGEGPARELVSSASAIALLDLTRTDRVISSAPLTFDFLKPLQTLKKNGMNIYVYGVAMQGDKYFYFPDTVTNVEYLDELFDMHQKGRISTSSSIIEDHKSFTQTKSAYPALKSNARGTVFSGNFKSEAFVVFRKNWYPEQHILLDGMEAKVYRTNLIHMGMFVPKGRHTIEIRYTPVYFYYGLAGSIAYLLAAILFGLKFIKR